MRSYRLTTILCCLAAAPAPAHSEAVPARFALPHGRFMFHAKSQSAGAPTPPRLQKEPPPPAALSYSFIDYPGLSSTQVFGLNLGAKPHGKMYVVGQQESAGGGFVLTPSAKGSGLIQNFQRIVPSEPTLAPLGVNDAGDIAGYYEDQIGSGVHGFLLEKSGCTTLDVPFGQGNDTQAFGVNNAGLVVGVYVDFRRGLTHFSI